MAQASSQQHQFLYALLQARQLAAQATAIHQNRCQSSPDLQINVQTLARPLCVLMPERHALPYDAQYCLVYFCQPCAHYLLRYVMHVVTHQDAVLILDQTSKPLTRHQSRGVNRPLLHGTSLKFHHPPRHRLQ